MIKNSNFFEGQHPPLFKISLNFDTKSKSMGKGDKKTKRGKIIRGSNGVRRLRKKSNQKRIS
jgi:ribosomal small subunit protein bTHX